MFIGAHAHYKAKQATHCMYVCMITRHSDYLFCISRLKYVLIRIFPHFIPESLKAGGQTAMFDGLMSALKEILENGQSLNIHQLIIDA